MSFPGPAAPSLPAPLFLPKVSNLPQAHSTHLAPPLPSRTTPRCGPGLRGKGAGPAGGLAPGCLRSRFWPEAGEGGGGGEGGGSTPLGTEGKVMPLLVCHASRIKHFFLSGPSTCPVPRLA